MQQYECPLGCAGAGLVEVAIRFQVDVGHPSVQRLEIGDDFSAPRLEEGGQHNLLTERRLVLIDAESGTVGRNLEQNAAGFPEVQATEPVAINLAAVSDAEL